MADKAATAAVGAEQKLWETCPYPALLAERDQLQAKLDEIGKQIEPYGEKIHHCKEQLAAAIVYAKESDAKGKWAGDGDKVEVTNKHRAEIEKWQSRIKRNEDELAALQQQQDDALKQQNELWQRMLQA